MKRTLTTAFIFMVALATLAGSRGTAADRAASTDRHDTEVVDPQKSGDELREEFHQNYPLSANGRVSIENINGGVRIAVWDQNEVKVDAVKRAYRRERLDEAKIEINSNGDSIRIHTEYPDRDQNFSDDEGRRSNNPAMVEYSLTIPRRARIESVELINGSLDIDGAEGDVKASSINGRVKARSLTGEIRLSTVNGNLEATLTKLDAAKPVNLSSVNGNIDLIIPSDSNAQIRAGTVHGNVSNDFGLPVAHGEYVGHELNGQLGNGATRIKLGNVNGHISIRHAADGRSLSSVTNLLADKGNIHFEGNGINNRELNEQIRQATEDARAAAREQVDAQRITREAQNQTQREIEKALRDSQREIQRAQQQIQRDVQRQVREQVREQTHNRPDGSWHTGNSWGRFVDRETKSFPVSGTPNVKVGTYDGAVTIRSWDKAEVSYTAIKRANHEESLKEIVIDASQQGSDVSIIARSKEHEDGSAALEIYVPRNANLQLSSDDGRITIQGVSGEMTIKTGDGAIEVDGGQGRVHANTDDGRIRVSSFQGSVDAQTGDGSITLEGAFTGVNAKTGDGSILLGVPADANFVVETNAEEVSNEGINISEESASSTKVKRWKIGRGGTVFTLSTGDGHVIIRSR
jgi:DUF4097 and DUF4098 domain-containing protein YvlB